MFSKPIKICIVVISLGKGGLERTTALLSRMLFNAGYDVHIVVLNDSIDYEYKGELLNLGLLKDGNETWISRWKRFKTFRNYVKRHKFDYIIDARSRQEPIVELLYLFYVYRKKKVIYAVHNFKIELYFTKSRWLAKLIVKKVNKIVCVSKAIQKKVDKLGGSQKSITIYNPIESIRLNIGEISPKLPLKYVLFLGRIDNAQKNLELLIDSYKISNLKSESVKLLITGEGPDEKKIKKYIEDNGLKDSVIMMSFTPNIYEYLTKALFLVLTSRFEGFPMVLIESLSVGIPVVAVDCMSGPNEIVCNEFNGLLVENDNPEKFAEAMDRLVIDQKLYAFCKNNTQKSIQHLSQEKILEQWKDVLKE